QFAHLSPFQNAAREEQAIGAEGAFPKRFAASSHTHKALDEQRELARERRIYRVIAAAETGDSGRLLSGCGGGRPTCAAYRVEPPPDPPTPVPVYGVMKASQCDRSPAGSPLLLLRRRSRRQRTSSSQRTPDSVPPRPRGSSPEDSAAAAVAAS